MTTDDSKAVLAAAIRRVAAVRFANAEEQAAAILAAMPGWTLVPKGPIIVMVDMVLADNERMEAEIARLRAANRAADEILVKHVIRVARYYWATGSHIETFANEARAVLAPALDDIHGTPTFSG